VILTVKQPISSRRNKPCHLQHPVDVFCAKEICVGKVQFMGCVNRVGYVALFGKSFSLSSLSLSGRPSNRKSDRRDRSLY
jgi:hypothetical protein